ncbi:unnamed protein product [Paramecium sonneborni]|uniref:Uncharacterized protein n=1 Tax=Paramecium sonneborni TaxID=65129 RepID=A0A8S1NY38_9CILI|nr:unnamed protein product [Paramecium sonneborni]
MQVKWKQTIQNLFLNILISFKLKVKQKYMRFMGTQNERIGKRKYIYIDQEKFMNNFQFSDGKYIIFKSQAIHFGMTNLQIFMVHIKIIKKRVQINDIIFSFEEDLINQSRENQEKLR